jgi:hypothetical protein
VTNCRKINVCGEEIEGYQQEKTNNNVVQIFLYDITVFILIINDNNKND